MLSISFDRYEIDSSSASKRERVLCHYWENKGNEVTCLVLTRVKVYVPDREFSTRNHSEDKHCYSLKQL